MESKYNHDLSPCKFCGNDRVYVYPAEEGNPGFEFPSVVCECCMVAVSGPPDEETLVEMWNTVPRPSSVNGLFQCPCCGGEGIISKQRNSNNDLLYFCICKNCGLRTGMYYVEDMAVNAWNRRTTARVKNKKTYDVESAFPENWKDVLYKRFTHRNRR